MSQRKRATVRDLRRDNRSVLLTSLYFDQPRSRQDLSEVTGLSPASVSNVIRELIQEGIVVEAGSVDSEGGRPRALPQINPGYGYVIGVGVPGIVEHGPEVLVHGQSFGWESTPLERLLRSGTGLPLDIDNGAKTMSQAELWFGAGRGAQHAVVCLIGSGAGAGIITNGRAHRGSTSSAAEWGHTTVAAGGRACRCGSRGCLEAYVGAEAILDRYGLPLPGDDQESALAALINSYPTSARAAQVLDETARYLGVGIANPSSASWPAGRKDSYDPIGGAALPLPGHGHRRMLWAYVRRACTPANGARDGRAGFWLRGNAAHHRTSSGHRTSSVIEEV
jgi:biotin operon repressor